MHAVRNLRSQVDANAENAANPVNGKRVLPARSARPALGDLANRAINKDSIQHQVRKSMKWRLSYTPVLLAGWMNPRLCRATSLKIVNEENF